METLKQRIEDLEAKFVEEIAKVKEAFYSIYEKGKEEVGKVEAFIEGKEAEVETDVKAVETVVSDVETTVKDVKTAVDDVQNTVFEPIDHTNDDLAAVTPAPTTKPAA